MQQQQQSKLGNMKPVKIGPKSIPGMDDKSLWTKPAKTKQTAEGAIKKFVKTTKGFSPKKQPTLNQVQKSIKKTMGYK